MLLSKEGFPTQSFPQSVLFFWKEVSNVCIICWAWFLKVVSLAFVISISWRVKLSVHKIIGRQNFQTGELIIFLKEWMEITVSSHEKDLSCSMCLHWVEGNCSAKLVVYCFKRSVTPLNLETSSYCTCCRNHSSGKREMVLRDAE